MGKFGKNVKPDKYATKNWFQFLEIYGTPNETYP